LVEWATLGEARGGLDANDRTLMELFNSAGAGIGAGTAHASDDRVDEVFNAGAIGLEIQATGTNALFEERSARCFDWGFVLCGAIHNSTS
jgi:hypothetical protein